MFGRKACTTVFATAAGNGIGRAAALAMARRGAGVFSTDQTHIMDGGWSL